MTLGSLGTARCNRAASRALPYGASISSAATSVLLLFLYTECVSNVDLLTVLLSNAY